jgi:hypothetical protein
MHADHLIKKVLGEIPLVAELDWALRGKGAPVGGYKLEEMKEELPKWCEAVTSSPLRHKRGQRVLIFATLHYWMSHAALTALALAGMGHDVTLGYYPYASWHRVVGKFDLRRRELYVKKIFSAAAGLIDLKAFSSVKAAKIGVVLAAAVEEVSVRDVQYSSQLEAVDKSSELFKLRHKRNLAAAGAASAWIESNKPDVIIVPNGHILEFGAVQSAAEAARVPVVSYEFGEQQERIWLARDKAVMLQDTDAMWAQKKKESFSKTQKEKVRELVAARQQADLFSNFYRRWQDVPSEGAQKVRKKLGLDNRPIVLLPANVIGDSLTLGRAIFSGNMSEWLKRSLEYFAEREGIQLLVRVHPGERNLSGPSVADLVNEILPEIPKHIQIVGAEDPINTYDLIQAADLGLVYTTTVGLEMAMSGLPVIVVGQTHYRAKGFTLDPEDWDAYFATLKKALDDPEHVQMNKENIEIAWHYAYRFFFDYPQIFPWHLVHFWRDVEAFPLEKLFSAEGQSLYRESFDILAGRAFTWENLA